MQIIRKSLSNALAKASTWLYSEQRPRSHRYSKIATDFAEYNLADDTVEKTSGGEQREYLELYKTLHWIFIAIKNIADSCALLPGRIIDKYTQEEITYEHDLVKLLDNPNNLLTRFKLFVSTVSYYCLVGNGYWFMERESPGGHITKIHVPRPDRVEVLELEKDGSVIYGRKRGETTPEKWNMKDVVHFSSFNPLSDYQGFGSAQGVEQSALIELFLITFSKRFFQNAVVPSLIFGIPEILDDASYERIYVELERLHKGVDKFFNVALLEGGVEPIEVKRTTPTDADYIEMKQLTREEILTAMGCYHLVALLNKESKATLELAYRLFYEVTLLPLLKNLEGTINKELLSQYDDSYGLEYKFDLRNAPGLRENILEQSQADYRYYISGIKTGSEIRRERGFGAPLDWSDKPPPTINVARSRMSPNESRAVEESQFAHPERYQLDLDGEDKVISQYLNTDDEEENKERRSNYRKFLESL